MTQMNFKNLAPLRAKNDVTYALQLKLHECIKKSRFDVVVTSYGRNKNRDDEIKNQEKAINSPSYRCAAIKKQMPHVKMPKCRM